jgi:hypothetical protein
MRKKTKAVKRAKDDPKPIPEPVTLNAYAIEQTTAPEYKGVHAFTLHKLTIQDGFVVNDEKSEPDLLHVVIARVEDEMSGQV